MDIIFIISVSLTLILWTWALFDLTRAKFKDNVSKLAWFAIILWLPVIGSIIYFQLKKKLTIRSARKFNPDFNHG